MYMVDEVLHEFKGELSLQDIYGMTYKELGYLREHRAKMLSDPNVQKAEAASRLLGI